MLIANGGAKPMVTPPAARAAGDVKPRTLPSIACCPEEFSSPRYMKDPDASTRKSVAVAAETENRTSVSQGASEAGASTSKSTLEATTVVLVLGGEGNVELVGYVGGGKPPTQLQSVLGSKV
jgi:hypothetical protein